ncbi:GPI mannosyltransferase 2 [[Candida] anglica]|uniref:GPI mannosyltransferase 2 n=1 Tax=[Candida] anglica TaxID=148631 RepID=A0ABP0ECX7_9ASCO
MSLKVVRRITALFFLVKIVQLTIVYCTPRQFDTSSHIILSSNIDSKFAFIHTASSYGIPKVLALTFTDILDKFVVWDNVYFSDLFVNDIKFEHQYVFCPLWWRFVKYIGDHTKGDFYTVLFIGTIIANLCHYLSCIVLYFFTLETFARSKFFNHTNLVKLSERTSLLYVLSPAGIFLTTSCSESPCALLTFIGLYIREISLDYNSFDLINSKVSVRNPITYIISGIIFAISYGIRANSVLLGVLYLYDLYKFFIVNQNMKDSILSLIAGSNMFIAIVISTWFPYMVFCPNGRGEWCDSYFPSLFSYAQSHYWNNGFMKYWTPNNIPNFIFALPTIILTVFALQFYIVRYPFKNILPILFVNILLLIGGIFWWHTQILTRISSFLPLIYWYIASLGLLNVGQDEIKVYHWSVRYFIIWSLLQTGLFAAFLPPA